VCGGVWGVDRRVVGVDFGLRGEGRKAGLGDVKGGGDSTGYGE